MPFLRKLDPAQRPVLTGVAVSRRGVGVRNRERKDSWPPFMSRFEEGRWGGGWGGARMRNEDIFTISSGFGSYPWNTQTMFGGSAHDLGIHAAERAGASWVAKVMLKKAQAKKGPSAAHTDWEEGPESIRPESVLWPLARPHSVFPRGSPGNPHFLHRSSVRRTQPPAGPESARRLCLACARWGLCPFTQAPPPAPPPSCQSVGGGERGGRPPSSRNCTRS